MTLARKTLTLLSALILSTFALSAFALAEGTRTWEQSKFEELTKGTAKGIALRSEGGLELAPAFKALATTPSTYIWSIASDSGGDIYAAAGSPARVYRITPDGQSATIFEPQELQVQALVVDKNSIVYAATAPDGKVYRLEPPRLEPAKGTAAAKAGANASWSASTYFDPGSKYIWDIVLDNAGVLYVATGDHGEIYKVSPNGQHRFSSRAMKSTFAFSHSIPKETLSPAPMAAGLSIASRRMAKHSFSTARPRKKLPRSPSTAPAISTPPPRERSTREA